MYKLWKQKNKDFISLQTLESQKNMDFGGFSYVVREALEKHPLGKKKFFIRKWWNISLQIMKGCSVMYIPTVESIFDSFWDIFEIFKMNPKKVWKSVRKAPPFQQFFWPFSKNFFLKFFFVCFKSFLFNKYVKNLSN